jgi:hypothetical protein
VLPAATRVPPPNERPTQRDVSSSARQKPGHAKLGLTVEAKFDGWYRQNEAGRG